MALPPKAFQRHPLRLWRRRRPGQGCRESFGRHKSRNLLAAPTLPAQTPLTPHNYRRLDGGTMILGPDGTFPRGKLNDNDEGACNIAISEEKDNVRIDFFTSVTWIAMPPQQALEFARLIVAKALHLNPKDVQFAIRGLQSNAPPTT